MTAENVGRKQRGKPFRPGQSGNPAGKPKGTRNALLAALDAANAERMGDVLAAIQQAAIGGDMTAARILADRAWPIRRGSTITLDLPQITAASDVVAAMGAIASAVANGRITTTEGAELAAIVQGSAKAIELHDLAERITALERKEPRL